MKQLLPFVLAWLPLLVLARFAGRPWRPQRIAFGAALAAFAGGMCMVELRRYHLVPAAGATVPLPFGLCLEDLLLFAILGASGALLSETILDRLNQPPR